MKILPLFIGLLGPLLSTLPGVGQTPATPAATPKPRPPFADDKQLLNTGSFELPRVQGRTPLDQGGSPIKYSQGEWLFLGPNAADKDGQIVGGLTNEQAHSGKQCLYLELKHARTPSCGYELRSSLIPVKPSETYRINIWGKMDAKSPIMLDQLIPSLRLQVDFIQADRETQAGESLLQAQQIPGTGPRTLFFTSEQWKEYFLEKKSPEDAAYVKVTWTVILPSEGGDITGTIYFDDAGIAGERAPLLDDPTQPSADGTTPAATPVTPATEAAPAVPAPVKAP